MTAPISTEWAIVWRGHWPQPGGCPETGTPHQMRPVVGTWVCTDCEAWFGVEEFQALASYGQAGKALAAAHQN